MAIPGTAFLGIHIENLFRVYTTAPALPTLPGFPFVESGAEEEAAAGISPTLIQSQQLGRAWGQY